MLTSTLDSRQHWIVDVITAPFQQMVRLSARLADCVPFGNGAERELDDFLAGSSAGGSASTARSSVLQPGRRSAPAPPLEHEAGDLCSLALILFSYLLALATFPLTLFYCVRVRAVFCFNTSYV